MINIFEILDGKFDLQGKIKNLSRLFLECGYFPENGYYINFDTYFNKHYFRKWKHSYGCYTLEEFQKEAGLSYYNNYSGEKYFYAKNEIDAIKYLQYVYNVTSFLKNCLKRDYGSIYSSQQQFFDIFDNQFKYILSKLGQKVIENSDEDYFIIVPSNDKTTRCANMQNKDEVTFLLYEYTSSLLIGNIAKKREILKLLANEVEPIISSNLTKYKSGPVHDIFNELGLCLNNFNIRHNNSDPLKPSYYHEGLKDFDDSDYEEIYDTTYDLILDAYLLNEYLNKKRGVYSRLKTKAGF